ncbi:hypothetical protein LINGRAHAP2_LOCUS31918, partial [Linum grandiflorum]
MSSRKYKQGRRRSNGESNTWRLHKAERYGLAIIDLVEFLSYCDPVKIQGVSKDCIRLMLFKWSFRGQAKRWLNSQPGNKFTTWTDISQAFI